MQSSGARAGTDERQIELSLLEHNVEELGHLVVHGVDEEWLGDADRADRRRQGRVNHRADGSKIERRIVHHVHEETGVGQALE